MTPAPMTSAESGELVLKRQLKWTISRHARRLFHLALAGLALAVVARRPEFVAVAAPRWSCSAPGGGQSQMSSRYARVAARPGSSRVSRWR